ncbi:MAG TPA: hypothetical protein DD670_09740 [Planctomycetaceae bacterium]|nr:hypothetical protein [Planctomycetaceae bacterium]
MVSCLLLGPGLRIRGLLRTATRLERTRITRDAAFARKILSRFSKKFRIFSRLLKSLSFNDLTARGRRVVGSGSRFYDFDG